MYYLAQRTQRAQRDITFSIFIISLRAHRGRRGSFYVMDADKCLTLCDVMYLTRRYGDANTSDVERHCIVPYTEIPRYGCYSNRHGMTLRVRNLIISLRAHRGRRDNFILLSSHSARRGRKKIFNFQFSILTSYFVLC